VTSSIRRIARSAETLQEATTGTARHLEELTRTVSSVASKATESSSLSQDSSRAADEGMTAVREASAAMDAISTSFKSLQECVSRLSERSTSIDEIVQVITAIAETKILALNASTSRRRPRGRQGLLSDAPGAPTRRACTLRRRITRLIRRRGDTSAATAADAPRIRGRAPAVPARASASRDQHLPAPAARDRGRDGASGGGPDRVAAARDDGRWSDRHSTREQESRAEIAKRSRSRPGLAVESRRQQRGLHAGQQGSDAVSDTLSQRGATPLEPQRRTIEQTRVFSEVRGAGTVRSITAAVSTC
jgi:hypothetical protein